QLDKHTHAHTRMLCVGLCVGLKDKKANELKKKIIQSVQANHRGRESVFSFCKKMTIKPCPVLMRPIYKRQYYRKIQIGQIDFWADSISQSVANRIRLPSGMLPPIGFIHPTLKHCFFQRTHRHGIKMNSSQMRDGILLSCCRWKRIKFLN